MVARGIVAAAGLAVALTWAGAGAVLAATPSPTPSAGSTQVCDQFPPDQAGLLARFGCDVSQQAKQAVAGAAGQVGQAVAAGAETDFTSWLANGAAWVVQNVTQLVVGSSATPSLDSAKAGAFTNVYGRVVGVALSLSALLVLLGIIEATITQRPGALRRVVAGIAVSGIGLGAVPVGTAVLVRITDDLSSYVAAGPSEQVTAGFKTLVQVLQQTNPNEGAAAFALISLGMMIGGALLWLELVVRASLIYVFLGVVPLACAAVQWPRLEGVLRQVLFGGLALIVSKLVVAIVLAVGFAVLSVDANLQSLLGGMFILLIAAFMPFATARVLPLAAEEMALSHQGRVRGTVVTTVGTTARLVAAVAGSGPGMAIDPAGPATRPAATESSRRPGPASSGPRPADGGPGAGGPAPGGPGPGGPGPGRPGPGRPRGGGPSPSGGPRSTGSDGRPAPGPAGRDPHLPNRPPDAPPRRGPRGPEPPVK